MASPPQAERGVRLGESVSQLLRSFLGRREASDKNFLRVFLQAQLGSSMGILDQHPELLL